METTRRSIVRADSWRIPATVVTTVSAPAMTVKWEFAATIGIAGAFASSFICFGHERAWDRTLRQRSRTARAQAS